MNQATNGNVTSIFAAVPVWGDIPRRAIVQSTINSASARK